MAALDRIRHGKMIDAHEPARRLDAVEAAASEEADEAGIVDAAPSSLLSGEPALATGLAARSSKIQPAARRSALARRTAMPPIHAAVISKPPHSRVSSTPGAII
jgi:hypothetical protein